MAAGGLDPYDDDDLVYVDIRMMLTRAELAMLSEMAKRALITKSMVVQAIMRDVIADEMAEQGAEKAA